MASAVELCSWSPGGLLLAIAALDGEIRVWEPGTGVLSQHISLGVPGVITAMAWSRPGKKRKHGKHSPSLLAVAVTTRIDVWNIDSGDKQLSLAGHSDNVSCVSWGKSCLFSGSHDCHVIQWAKDGSLVHKWKVDRHYVTSVCCHGDQHLLTAGRSIKLWSLNDYSLVKKLVGHGSDVLSLGEVSDNHFLSTAANDRTINIWTMADDTRAPVITLSCDEEVRSCDIRLSDEVIEAVAVSMAGSCHLFRADLTNQITEPLSAFSSIQIASSDTKNPMPLPIIAAHMTDHMTDHVMLAHTSAQRPKFETIDFNQSDRRICLVRESGGLLLSQQSQKGKSPKDHVTILGPGNMTVTNQKSNKSSNQISENLPLKERLDPDKRTGGSMPSAESLSQLLSQAVASGDGKLLEEVLRVSKERIIRATIRRLPVTIVTPLLTKLVEMVQYQPGRGLELSIWLRALVTTHASYLMTVPTLSAPLSSLYQLLEARVECYNKLARLQGKLDLCLSCGPPGDSEVSTVNAPLITVTAGDDSIGSIATQDIAIAKLSEDDWTTDDSSDQSDDSMDTHSGSH